MLSIIKVCIEIIHNFKTSDKMWSNYVYLNIDQEKYNLTYFAPISLQVQYSNFSGIRLYGKKKSTNKRKEPAHHFGCGRAEVCAAPSVSLPYLVCLHQRQRGPTHSLSRGAGGRVYGFLPRSRHRCRLRFASWWTSRLWRMTQSEEQEACHPSVTSLGGGPLLLPRLCQVWYFQFLPVLNRATPPQLFTKLRLSLKRKKNSHWRNHQQLINKAEALSLAKAYLHFRTLKNHVPLWSSLEQLPLQAAMPLMEPKQHEEPL